jgi:ArsR family transcriptional regulator, arsenate/arsenite/antimonite-responsive transcriptional repressor
MDNCQYRQVSISRRTLPVLDDALACCAPLGVEAMSAEQADLVADLLKALSDPIRLRLMSLIAAADEACVCDLTTLFAVSQPTISHHLKVLREAGLVESERRGTWVWYRARREALDAVGGLFTDTLAHA